MNKAIYQKIYLTVIVLFWLVVLVLVEQTRHVFVHDYMHLLPSDIENIPLSARYISIPIIAATSITGITKTPFYLFWGFVWIWPIMLMSIIWFKSTEENSIIRIWVLGISFYAFFLFSSIILLSFSLWLPLRYSS